MNSIEFAINMELEGEKYYKEQAIINKDNSLSAVFLLLAKDEENHVKILKDNLRELIYELRDNNILSSINKVFKGVRDFKKEVSKFPNQSELYREALHMEKQSIELYKDFLDQAIDVEQKTLFEFLLKEEKNHLAIVEDLVGGKFND